MEQPTEAAAQPAKVCLVAAMVSLAEPSFEDVKNVKKITSVLCVDNQASSAGVTPLFVKLSSGGARYALFKSASGQILPFPLSPAARFFWSRALQLEPGRMRDLRTSKARYDELIRYAFGKLEWIVDRALPSRTRMQALSRLGFRANGELELQAVRLLPPDRDARLDGQARRRWLR